MSMRRDLRLTMRQIRSEFRSFWRNPAAAGFTFVFPLMFMVIFNLLFDQPYAGRGIEVNAARFFTPAIIALSVVSACFTNIAMGVVFAREEGILKRVRGTPLPAWSYLAGRIGNSIIVAAMLVVIVAAFGAVFYDVPMPGSTLPAFIVTLIVGAGSLCAIGLAATTLVPNEDAAPPVVNFMVLPLLFISDVFIPLDNAPAWLTTIANVFPIKHLSNSLLTSFIPGPAGGSGFVAGDLIVMGAWGVGAAIVAARTFRWEPSR